MKITHSTAVISSLLWLAAILLSGSTQAGEFVQYSDTIFSLHSGRGYQLPGDQVNLAKLENSSRWIGGDFYGWVDFSDLPDHPNNQHTWYGELSPRFSLSKIAGMDFDGGLVKDVLIATTWERGEGGNESFLAGAGVSLDVPGFSFFKTNLYARKDISRGAGFDDMQLTFAWKYPFSIGESQWFTSIIGDYVFGWGPRARNFHVIPQVNMDIGKRSGIPNRFFLGLKLDYWSNQFGVKNTNTWTPTNSASA